MLRFDLRHLRCFLQVAQELHFSRAAERLHMAQPALSRTIRELEAEVGTALFQRSTRQVSLTVAGEAFLKECRAGLAQIERGVAKARRVAEGTSGELRVAYMDFAINGRLPELVRLFRERHPEIRLELHYMPTSRQQAALLERRIDIGFMLDGMGSEVMTSYPLAEDSYVALLPATHRLADVPGLTLSALAQEPFVIGTGDDWFGYRETIFAMCRQRGFFPDIIQEASSSQGIFGLVAAGAGVSVYSSCVRNVQRRGIVVRELDDVRAAISIRAVWEREHPSPTVQRFAEFLLSVWGR
ncbi:LysR family transcriptional regulator [Rhodovarius crocodyli]|uniref:LysR family transcriptional regulator n=1 Tax=Rhodovarius crocodyli TaxID=1979269 RepID=A0A437MN69_9PROT|nr:LysR substrate-binding domain-containing protein [Rhodovarius crocodyli]RVT99060.1 LysR family transcriptional regulator [Rhodovarius crocodyli]